MEKIADFINALICSDIFLISFTVIVFYSAQWLRDRSGLVFVNPVVISAGVIILFLKGTGVDYQTYNQANGPLNFMLGISVVSLGYLMYKNFEHIKDYKFSIIVSTFIGSVVGVLSIVLLCRLFGVEDVIMLSLQPKSVTTPIALSLSENIGGVPAITSLAVVITGVFGSVVGSGILNLLGVSDPIAQGVALGSASHAIGTARALELGAQQGAVGGVAIGLMGLFTSIIIPFLGL